MKIAIKPVQSFVSGKGLMTAAQVEVKVVNYDLGNGARCSYELQWVDPANPKAPTQTIATGQIDLKPEQFAAWGSDDTVVAKAIIQNIGLEAAA
jgi:hypothetical protein